MKIVKQVFYKNSSKNEILLEFELEFFLNEHF